MKHTLTLLILAVWTPLAFGQTTWQVAPGRSTISFKVRHLILFEVEGKFKKFNGTVVTKKDEFSDARIDVTIPVSSIYTGNKDRDNNLQDEDFFYAERYPTIRFTSGACIKTGEDTYRINGKLTIRDVTCPIELTAVFKSRKDISGGRTRVDFTATGSVNRFDYGLRWNELLEVGKPLIGETVEIILKIALLSN